MAAFGLGFGQGLSNLAQNFVSGCDSCSGLRDFFSSCQRAHSHSVSIIALELITIGDWVTVDQFEGEVVKIGITHTTLKSIDGESETAPQHHHHLLCRRSHRVAKLDADVQRLVELQSRGSHACDV